MKLLNIFPDLEMGHLTTLSILAGSVENCFLEMICPNKLPQSLCNGPVTSQRLMDLVLAGFQMSHCLVYVDDVIVMDRSFQEHLCNLYQVFERLRVGTNAEANQVCFI